MIWEVLKKEIRTNISSPKVVITYAVCVVLILTAFSTGIVNYLSLIEEAVEREAAERDRLSNVYQFRQDVLGQGISVYRRPDILSVLVGGVEGDAAQRGNITNFANPGFDVSRFNSAPILALFGLLDLGFIVTIILSLFVILFTFDAVSGEKELGTLKLNFSNAVKRSDFIIGKLIGNFLLLLIPFVIPLLLGLLVMQFVPGVGFSGEDWSRAGLIFLAFILYLLVFYSLGMMVSALTKRSSVSFLILLMLWVLFIGVIPRISVLIAQNVYPVPPLYEVTKAYISRLGPENDRLGREIGVEQRRLIQEIQQRRPLQPVIRNDEAERAYEERLSEFQAWAQGRVDEFFEMISERIEDFSARMQDMGREEAERHKLKQDLQNDFAVGLSRLTSPVAALTFAANRLSRTGVYSSDEVFRNWVEEQVREVTSETNEFLRNNLQLIGFAYMPDEPLDTSGLLPDAASYKREPWNESVAASLQDFAVLAILSIIFFSIAFVAFIRYDVR